MARARHDGSLMRGLIDAQDELSRGRAMLRWHFRRHLRGTAGALKRRDWLRASMLAAEVVGTWKPDRTLEPRP